MELFLPTQWGSFELFTHVSCGLKIIWNEHFLLITRTHATATASGLMTRTEIRLNSVQNFIIARLLTVETRFCISYTRRHFSAIRLIAAFSFYRFVTGIWIYPTTVKFQRRRFVLISVTAGRWSWSQKSVWIAAITAKTNRKQSNQKIL